MTRRGEPTLVTTSCADRESAKRLANLIAGARLAACVQLFLPAA